jgi:hypothetical protein
MKNYYLIDLKSPILTRKCPLSTDELKIQREIGYGKIRANLQGALEKKKAYSPRRHEEFNTLN